MQKKWYKKNDIVHEYEHTFHCWGEKIGMSIAFWDGKKWLAEDNTPVDKRYTHFMPFPLEPRIYRR